MKLKCLASISSIDLELFQKSIIRVTGLWLPVPSKKPMTLKFKNT